jgi:uncharacterized membrane protein YebE (DUF533 family)
MTPGWKNIDIADIMHEQLLLKATIEASLEDGEIDAEEYEKIEWQLKRAGQVRRWDL